MSDQEQREGEPHPGAKNKGEEIPFWKRRWLRWSAIAPLFWYLASVLS